MNHNVFETTPQWRTCWHQEMKRIGGTHVPKKNTSYIYIYVPLHCHTYVWNKTDICCAWVFNSKAPKLGKFVVLHKSLVLVSTSKVPKFWSPRVSGATNFHGRNVTRRLSPWIPRSPMCRPHPCPTLRPAGLAPNPEKQQLGRNADPHKESHCKQPQLFQMAILDSVKKSIYQLS